MEFTALRRSGFDQLRPEVQRAAWIALALAVLVISDQQHYWRTSDDFSFGFLVPLFVAFVLNDRWPLLKGILIGDPAATVVAAENSPSGALNFLAGLGVCGSLLFFLYGGILRAVTGPDYDSAAALSLGLAGFVLAMGFLVSRTNAQGHLISLSKRGRVVALLIFPALAWLISAPMLLVLESHVKPLLLEWVVTIVSTVFNGLGFEVFRDEHSSVLVLPHGSVGVADACSGIRSLTACLFAGSFLAAVFLDRFWKKILLLSMSAVLAFCMNVVRSMFLTGWAYAYGSDMLDADFWGNPEFTKIKDATGQIVSMKDAAGHAVPNPAFHFISVHDFAGYLVLGLTLAGLLLLLPILNFKIKLPDLPPPPGDFPPPPA